MSNLKLSTRKLNALQHACLQNALNLHFDSILLAKSGSFGSAFTISVIASEELGKAFAIEEITFQRAGTGKVSPHDHQFVRALLSNHKLKQGWFTRIFVDPLGPSGFFDSNGVVNPRGTSRRYQTIQGAKNDAIYVGLRKGNHQIVRPFRLPPSKAKQQIRMVNKALVDATEGTLDGRYGYEEVADRFFRNRRLLKKLLKAYKTVS